MKKILLSLLIILLYNQVRAQNISVSTETFNYNGFAVSHYGLGWYGDPATNTAYGPMAYFTAFGGIKFFTTGSPRALLDINGNFGIGTMNPASRLTLAGGTNPNPNNSGAELDYVGLGLTFREENGSNNFNLGNIKMVQPNGYYLDRADMVFYTAAGGGTNSEKLRITGSGNVLVGKTIPTNSGYKLDVAGSIRANQIVVNTTGADFVFAPAYRLNSLESVKAFIAKNHHLPEIPSAAEMQTNGVAIGDLQIKMLQKIEELTLYLIEKDKQLKQQQIKLARQERRIAVLEHSRKKN